MQEKESESLRHLFGIYSCYGRLQCRLAMLTAYLDESGIHDGDHLCIVAGFVGTEAHWTSFAKEWTAALHPRTSLHMNALRWRQHPDRVGKLLSKLGPLPEKHLLDRIIGGMHHKDYQSIVKGRIRDSFAKPWMLAAQLCIAQTLRCIPKDEQIGFVFEEQRGYQPMVQALYDSVFRLGKIDDRVKGISFVKKNSVPGLDASDYLAFQVREYTLDEHSPKAKLGMSILGTGDAIGHIWRSDQIQAMVDDWVAKGVLIP